MRTRLLVLLIAALAVMTGSAWAEGPSGSSEGNDREVECGEGTDTPIGRNYAGSNGVEACSDDNAAPDGRIIVDFGAQYASVDGDPSNGANADGFVRLDSGGPSCGDDEKHDSSEGPGADCG